LPVVSFEQHVEPQILPSLDPVVGHDRDRRIDEANTADDLQPFSERNNGCNPLVSGN
jgi:hypothetical protein